MGWEEGLLHCTEDNDGGIVARGCWRMRVLMKKLWERGSRSRRGREGEGRVSVGLRHASGNNRPVQTKQRRSWRDGMSDEQEARSSSELF